jgi:hypothetical protein
MNLHFRNSSQMVFVIAMTMFLLSCDDPADLPNAKGDIVGYLKLTDTAGNIRSKHDGVTVEIIGRVNTSVLTNENGKFEFKNIPSGSYSIRATKKGYDSYQLDAISHLGGSVNLLNYPSSSVSLAPKSPNKISQWEAQLLTSGSNTFLEHYLKVRVIFEQTTFNANSAVIIFINDEPGVSPENYSGVLHKETLNYVNGAYEEDFSLFGNRPLKGSTQYLKIYGYNGGTPYKSIESGMNVYPSLGEGSAELSFTYQ